MRESDIQQAIVEFLAVVTPETVVFAIPNAAVRTAAGYASNAVPGLRKGVWDLCLLFVDSRVAFIEVKNETGKLSPEQMEFGFDLTVRRIPKCVARSVDDVRMFLALLGVKTREAK